MSKSNLISSTYKLSIVFVTGSDFLYDLKKVFPLSLLLTTALLLTLCFISYNESKEDIALIVSLKEPQFSKSLTKLFFSFFISIYPSDTKPKSLSPILCILLFYLKSKSFTSLLAWKTILDSDNLDTFSELLLNRETIVFPHYARVFKRFK